jgi:hypothetical protein
MKKCFGKGFGGSCKFDFIEFNFDTVNIHFVLVESYIDTLFNEFSTSVEMNLINNVRTYHSQKVPWSIVNGFSLINEWNYAFL